MKSRVKSILDRRTDPRIVELETKVKALEQDVTELRRHYLRMAELTDVVQELLIPMASRDEEAIAAAIAKFNASL
ncbi:MAG: hypothetical protein QM638_07355 [Nocardioides sp.]|uniref:DUF6752 domain-containing protein n=1 Tax=Nocardioides sp. TaxID=35761 RepID=UPI0039E4E996